MSRVRSIPCTRCGDGHGSWRGPWCCFCEEQTRGSDLQVLVFEDRSAIFGMYESIVDAGLAYTEDTQALGIARLRRVAVRDQGEARAMLRGPDDDGWDRRESAWDRAEFERGVL